MKRCHGWPELLRLRGVAVEIHPVLPGWRNPDGMSGKRAVDFVVFGFSDWDPLTKFLAGNIAGPAAEQVWPQVVFTDLHKGTRSYPTRPSDVRELPGYQFAMRCLERGIPCVAFTSGEAMTTHPYVFQDQDMLLFFDREEFKIGGLIGAAFVDKLWPRLSRRIWLPEFTLAVEGRKNENHKSFTVTFYDWQCDRCPQCPKSLQRFMPTSISGVTDRFRRDYSGGLMNRQQIIQQLINQTRWM